MPIYKFDANLRIANALSIVGGVFVLDRILKIAAQIKEISVTLVPHLLKLEFYPNYKGPFSLPIPQLVTIIISVSLIIIFLILIYYKRQFRLPLIVVTTGAISNLFDRIFFGYTIDTFHFLNFSFFNLADGLIFIGIFLLTWKLCTSNLSGK